ncbi:MAG: S9 family peptidase [Cytophagales bacterium]|nr:MAG: S9 family peptidase [Cytophagales bacterium]TAF60704.1 MAG: S9 family peptidase [Cytophagales bacterium]
MKKLYFLFCLSVVLACVSVASAQKKNFAIEELVSPRLRPTAIWDLTWRAKTDFVTYTDNATGNLMLRNAQNGQESILIKSGELDNQLPQGVSSLSKGVYFVQWQNDQSLVFSHDNRLFEYNTNAKKLKQIAFSPENAANHDQSSAQHWAFTVDENLWVCPQNATEPIAITQDGNRDLVYGQSVHRNEFGIVKGTFWSPDGQKLAFYRMDQKMVTDYPLTSYSTVPAQNAPTKYPMAGQASHHVTVGVWNTANKQTVYLKTEGPSDQYLTNISWSADNKSVFIAVLNRDQNAMQLNQYDAATGNFIKTLFEEKNERYVEPEHGLLFLPNNPNQFIWQSERDGFNHLYLYQIDGTLVKQLTKGAWLVNEILGFDVKGEELFYTSSQVSPLEKHAYSLNLKTNKTTQLTAESGTHDVQLSHSGKYLIDNYSSRQKPRCIQLVDIVKKKTTTTVLDAPNPLEAYDVPSIEFLKLKAEDNTDLYCRMLKPTNFEQGKKYPVMFYVYGGPHAQMNTETWLGGADMFMLYMAQQGYVVFTLDNRGSANRGFDFESIIHRQLGEVEKKDQLKGIDFLKQQTFVDASRIGVFGWSFGGFMTTNLLLNYPDVFKAGVAGGSVMDWSMYEIMYGERYMDRPEQNPAGYAQNNLVKAASKLKKRLLLIHGLQDDVVLPQHTDAFINECIKNGVLVDFFPYPNHAHNVRGAERAHLWKKIFRFFEDFVKPL